MADNPIIETYRGRPIRKYNVLFIRISHYELKKLIDLKEDHKISPRKAIQSGYILCNCDGVKIEKSIYAKGG